MNAPAHFNALAEAATYTGKVLATTYRVDVRDADGELQPVGDTHDTFDAGFNDYVESHKWWPHDDLIVWELSEDGMATDVTDRMIYEAEMLCERRGIKMEWTT